LRKKGSHEHWEHPDSRFTTIPIHANQEIGSPLYNKLLKQLGITVEEFRRLI